jgi:hypothetical protein
LEQLVPYIGGDGGKIGRTFSARSGIIGKAVREKKGMVGKRLNENHAKYIDELVSSWSYTREDARGLTEDRRSWLAIPIFHTNRKVEAVVYLDSDEVDFFTDQIVTLVTNSCAGIASYCKERFK